MDIGRPRMTSFFVQVWMPPQCAQVKLCVFTLAIRQRFSSIVWPVSVSFDVEGQRTSRLLRLGPTFAFGRRGGSKRNLVAMSESVNDPRLGNIIRRHLHFHPVPDRKADKTFAHPPGNVREHEVIIFQGHPKHCPGQHAPNRTFQFDGFFSVHDVDLAMLRTARPRNFRGRLRNQFRIYRRLLANERFPP